MGPQLQWNIDLKIFDMVNLWLRKPYSNRLGKVSIDFKALSIEFMQNLNTCESGKTLFLALKNKVIHE